MDDDISLGKACERMQRERARVARSRASKPDMTRLKPRKSGQGVAQAVDHAAHPLR